MNKTFCDVCDKEIVVKIPEGEQVEVTFKAPGRFLPPQGWAHLHDLKFVAMQLDRECAFIERIKCFLKLKKTPSPYYKHNNFYVSVCGDLCIECNDELKQIYINFLASKEGKK